MTTRVDYLVVGAGRAGLRLGYFLQRSGRDHLILKSGETSGTFFRTFPRHRQLISINKPYTGSAYPGLNLRMDWNSLLSDDPEPGFTEYSDRYFPAADELVRYLFDFLGTYQVKSQNALLDGNILNIERDDSGYLVAVSFAQADEMTKDLRYDRVIVCTRFRFDDSIFTAGCRPELVIDDRFSALTSEWESANVPDLYFAGNLMQVRDFKRSTSGPGGAAYYEEPPVDYVHDGDDWTSPTAHHDPLRAFLEGRRQPVAVPATTAG